MVDTVTNTRTTSGYKMSRRLKTWLALNHPRLGTKKMLVNAEKHALLASKKASKDVARDTSEV